MRSKRLHPLRNLPNRDEVRMNIPRKASSFPPKPLTALHLIANATVVSYVPWFWVNHYDVTGLPHWESW